MTDYIMRTEWVPSQPSSATGIYLFSSSVFVLTPSGEARARDKAFREQQLKGISND